MHARAIARGPVNGFGDRECIALGPGGIELCPICVGVDGDMDVAFRPPKKSGHRELIGDVLCDQIRTVHVFAKVEQRCTDCAFCIRAVARATASSAVAPATKREGNTEAVSHRCIVAFSRSATARA
jgi:hypothetical protein